MSLIIPGEQPSHRRPVLLDASGAVLRRLEVIDQPAKARVMRLDAAGQPVGESVEIPVQRITWTVER
jgi:hypothetical protein